MRMILAAIVLACAGCGDVVVRPQIKLWPDINVPPRPWFKSADEAAAIWANVETVEDCQPDPVIVPVVNVPEPQKAKPTAAIHYEGSRMYIVRWREKCYWSASKGAWMKPKRGACAGGICGYEAIKPGE